MASAFDRFYDKSVTVSGRCLHPETRAQVAFQFDALAMVNFGQHSPGVASAFGVVLDFDAEICIQFKDWGLVDEVPKKGMSIFCSESNTHYVIDSFTKDDFHYCINVKTADKKDT